jgi:signal transduction histidine kinase
MSHLDFRLASGIVVALGCVGLAVLVYLNNSHRKLNRLFAFSNLSLALWNSADLVMVAMSRHPSAIYVDRLSYLAGIPVIYLYYLLGLEITETTPPKNLLRGLKALSLFMATVMLTPWVLKDVRVVNGRIEEIPGPLYPVLIFYFIGYLGHGLYLLYQGHRKATGIKRNQLRYFSLGLFFAFLAGASYFGSLMMPHAPPIYYVLEAVYLTILAYAIVRYKLMDINLVFRYASTYLLFAVTLTLPFGLLVMLSSSKPWVIFWFFWAVLIAPLCEKRLIGWFRRFVDRLPPFRGRYDYLHELPGFQRAISTSSSVKHWARNLADSINRLVEVDNAGVFVFDEGHQMYMASSTVGIDLGRLVFASPKEGDAMVEHLRNTRAVLQRDYIDHEVPATQREAVARSLGLIGAALCLPFFNGDRLIGFVSVGAKRKRGGAVFKPSHFEIKIIRDYLDFPPVHTPNARYVHGKLSKALGLGADGDALRLTAEEIAEGFNRLAGQTGWAAGLPQPDSMGLRSEALVLLGKLRRGLALIPPEESALNAAVVAHFYRAGLKQYEQEDTFNEEDIKALESLVKGAEGALMVIFVTLAGQMKTAEWAHDLRHPFTKGSFRLLDAALAGKQGPLTPELYQTISTVLADAKFVEERITDLVSPETAGAMRLKAVNMTALLKSLVGRYKYFAEVAGVDFSLKLVSTEDVWVLCDAGLIQYRVFNNLIDNAFRYTPRGGSVEIGVAVVGSQANCFIRNTGGDPIPSNILPHLFERGGSLKRAESGERGLAGLGLYNASTVVEAQGGKFQVESNREHGTLFQFTLPLAGVELTKP